MSTRLFRVICLFHYTALLLASIRRGQRRRSRLLLGKVLRLRLAL